MSKALEALNNIRRLLISEYQHLADTVEKALTPPTAEEVCKALSEYYGFEVVHEGLDFIPKIEHYYYEIVSVADDCVVFATPLPPHLITLIGRFYEGVEYE